MAKTLKNPYDPQIPPERVLESISKATLDSLRGTKSFKRMGDQYIVTCTCGDLTVTGNMTLAVEADDQHAAC